MANQTAMVLSKGSMAHQTSMAQSKGSMAAEEAQNISIDIFRLTRSSQVTWAGPHSKKGNKGNNQRTSGVGDEESLIEGNQAREISQKVIFERKRRNCCEGDYPKKPPHNARPIVYFLNNQKGFRDAKPKKTLGYIVRMKWDEHTIFTKGANREAFFNTCINCFKDYYAYPKGCIPEEGDRVVRAHLKRNWKYYTGCERTRLVKLVNTCLDAGYAEKDIDITIIKPHYFSQKVWNSFCEYWGTPQFKTMSVNGKLARRMVEFTSRSGAKPYDQRREEIDEEREAKGELPIPDDEFLTMVYDPTDPAVKELQEKMKKARAELEADLNLLNSPTDEPPSPRTQREIQRIRDITVTVEARAPKKGKVILHPQETLAELMGGKEALRLINKRKAEESSTVIGVPDDIYTMMSMILDQVTQMVRSLPEHEVQQSILDEEVRNLATAAFPDPSQRSMHNHYIRAASGMLRQIVKDNDRIIAEARQVHPDKNPNDPQAAERFQETRSKKVPKKSVVEGINEDPGNNEDEDLEAYMFPLV